MWIAIRTMRTNHSGIARVAVRHERQIDHSCRQRFAAHYELHAIALLRMGGGNITHRNRPIDSGAKTTRCDGPDLLACGGKNLRPFAGDRTAHGSDADTQPLRPFSELA